MATPAQPRVEVEASRNIRKLTERSGVDWYRVGLNLLPECLADTDDIPVGLRVGEVLISASTAPDAQAVEEVEPLTVPNGMPAARGVGPEINRAGEDPPETLDPSAVVRAILRQIKVFEDLGGGPEDHVTALLSDGKGGDPDWDQAVLAERKSVLWVPRHLQPEPAVPARVLQRARWRATNR